MNTETNYEMSGGSFNCQRRILATFTIELNPSNGRFLVRDDRLNGKVCAAGFTSIEQARKAFEWQDLRRVAI